MKTSQYRCSTETFQHPDISRQTPLAGIDSLNGDKSHALERPRRAARARGLYLPLLWAELERTSAAADRATDAEPPVCAPSAREAKSAITCLVAPSDGGANHGS